MGSDGLPSISTLLGFLFALVRISGLFVFLPLPGLKSAVDPARILLSLAVTVSLYPFWSHPATFSPGLLVTGLFAEVAFGAGIGLAVAFVMEAFAVGMQMVSLQAGYSFASTVDPLTQADSTVLVSLSQTFASLLFFAMGLDREVIRVLARSMTLSPPGTFVLQRGAAEALVLAGSGMFSSGLRLALPIVAVMMMVEISIALLSRVNSQLHLMSVAFPIKMILALGLVAWTAMQWPRLLSGAGAEAFSAMNRLLGR
jgi:flagellar biosynthesis protein FliR